MAAHAAAKARDVVGRTGIPPGGAVLGADTAVVLDETTVLGKPADRDEARRMLSALASREHVVMTAVCLVGAEAVREFVDQTTVRFRPFGPAHLNWYLDRGEWHGRAGAYAIQGSGASLVERVEGDFTTVVGLPMAQLLTELEAIGITPWGE